MATSVYTDLSNLDEHIHVSFFEALADSVNWLNSMSNNTITINNGLVKGSINKTAFYDKRTTVARRDITSTAARTRVGHTKDTIDSVVLNRIMADDIHASALQQDGDTIAAYAAGVAQKFVEDRMAVALNSALSALVGAIESEATLTNDDTGASNTMSQARINETKVLLGDQRQRIRGIFMHSVPYAALIAELIGSAANAVTEIGMGIHRDDNFLRVFGSPIYVTDSAALDAGGGDYNTLLLPEGACMLTDHDTVPVTTDLDRSTDNVILEHVGEYNQELTVKGFAYGTGGANPTDATLASSANWTYKFSDVKIGPGALLKTDG